MNTKFNKLSKYIQGKWILLENFYFLTNNNVKNQEGSIELIDFKKIMNQLEIKSDNFYSLMKVEYLNGCDNDFIEKQKTVHNTLIASIRKKDGSLLYEEKLYNTSENIILAFGILKNVKKNKYIGLKVSSLIRIL